MPAKVVHPVRLAPTGGERVIETETFTSGNGHEYGVRIFQKKKSGLYCVRDWFFGPIETDTPEAERAIRKGDPACREHLVTYMRADPDRKFRASDFTLTLLDVVGLTRVEDAQFIMHHVAGEVVAPVQRLQAANVDFFEFALFLRTHQIFPYSYREVADNFLQRKRPPADDREP